MERLRIKQEGEDAAAQGKNNSPKKMTNMIVSFMNLFYFNHVKVVIMLPKASGNLECNEALI